MIPVTLTTQSRLSSLDFNDIPFGKVFSDHMFYAEYDNGSWQKMEIRPLEKLELHPSHCGGRLDTTCQRKCPLSQTIHVCSR